MNKKFSRNKLLIQIKEQNLTRQVERCFIYQKLCRVCSLSMYRRNRIVTKKKIILYILHRRKQKAIRKKICSKMPEGEHL